MDTDALLAEIREFAVRWQDIRQPLTTDEYDQAIEKVVELDRQLSRGERPPMAWRPPILPPLKEKG